MRGAIAPIASIVTLALSLPGVLEAAKPPAAPPPGIAIGARAEAALVDVAGVGQFDAGSGVARTLHSVAFQGDPADPVATARGYLAWDAARLGLGGAAEAAELPVRWVRAGKAATVVRFAQTLDGLPVHGGEIAVAVGPGGWISFVSSSYLAALGPLVNRPRLDGAAALDAAVAHLGADAVATLALDQRIFRAADGARVVWRALIDPKGEPEGEWEVLVDAETGAILAAEDKLFYVDGTGKVFEPDPLSSALVAYGTTGYVDGNDADTPQLTAQTFDVTLRDLTLSTGTYSLLGPYAACIDWDTPVGTCPTNATGIFPDTRASQNFEGVNVYHHIDSMMRYLNVTLGLGIMPHQYSQGVQFDPHGFNGADNSSYSSGTGRLRFGEGGVDDAEDADVVIHELGHGLHDWATGGSLSQAQGLSEGVGDYFAQSYSWAYPNQWTPGAPAYHWVFDWDGHNPFWSGRVTNWVVVPTRVFPTHLSGSIHSDGQFWSTCSLRSWQVIGRDLMDAAMVEGLAMTGGASNQVAAAQAVLQAAWNMAYSPSALQVIQNLYSGDGCGHNPAMPTSPDMLFFEGFETGDVCRWSDAEPPPGCP